MPDLLSHALLAYSICRGLSLRYTWIDEQYVTIGMVGAFLPDLVKVELLLSSTMVSELLGVQVDWGSLHTGGGVVLSVLIGLTLLSVAKRRRAGTLLALGAGSHLIADGLMRTATGRTLQLFFPISQYRLHSPGLYLSTHVEPLLATSAGAVLVWLVHRSWQSHEPAP